MERLTTRDGVRLWVLENCGLVLPERGVCEGHDSPLDYLCHAFFEGGDCLVWACRGGGKTKIGAVATLMDMMFKPGIQVRILAGSVEQAEKMYEYLRAMVEEKFAEMVKGKPRARGMTFKNGSRVEVLSQSEKSVRGTHVQKLRCDEIDLFEQPILRAAKLVPKSAEIEGQEVVGAMEEVSTMHVVDGTMYREVERMRAAGGKVFTWCVWDVAERCLPEKRKCKGCALEKTCGGKARESRGYFRIEDLITMHRRSSMRTWDNEMLCLQPRQEEAVFAGFDRNKHVTAEKLEGARRIMGVDFGYVGGFAAVWVMIVGEGYGARAHVVGEYVRPRMMLKDNVGALVAKNGAEWPSVVHADPAGRSPNSQTGVSDIRVLSDAGFKVRYKGQHISVGIDLMERMLSPASGPPRLTIDPGCEELIKALEQYQWDTARKGKKPLKDNVHDHVIDALRYGLTGELLPGARAEFLFYA